MSFDGQQISYDTIGNPVTYLGAALTWRGRELAGSIALRKLDDKTCEMKRLYVYPKFRGRGIARKLVEKIIADSREIGYSVMLLDTLPFLENAIRLYKSMGFYEIPCYNNSPMDNSIFLRYDI